jgi:hypothetical protein
MKVSQLKSGYMVCHNDDMIRIFNTLEEAKELISFHGGDKTWSILEIQVKSI